MSAHAKILCKNCNNNFYVYSDSLNKSELEITCPYCSKKVESNMSKAIAEAVSTVDALNRQLQKYNLERHDPLFVLSVEEVYVPKNNNK